MDWAALAVIACGAGALRWWAAAGRALHTDEAVNGVLLAQGWNTAPSGYVFDPEDRHGPTLLLGARVVLGILGVGGVNELADGWLRLFPAVVGGMIPLLLAWVLGDAFRGERLLAALLCAVAAPLVYYGGMFIHETLLVAAFLLFAGCLLRMLRRPSRGACVATGTAAGVMLATKITAFLFFAAAAVATCAVVCASGRRAQVSGLRWTHGAWMTIGLLGTYLSLVTSLGTHPGAAVDMVGSLGRFAVRAGGEGHEKPWWTFASWYLLPQAGGMPAPGSILLLAAVAGAWLAWRRRGEAPSLLWLTVFGAALWTVHALIPYKTPWLVLAVFATACGPAAALLAAVGRIARDRRKAVLVAAIATAAGTAEAWWWTRTRGLHPANPMAYAPTSPDVVRLDPWLRAVLGEERGAFLQVVGDDVWPLPWYLRGWSRVGYWAHPPDGRRGDAVIVTGSALVGAESWLGVGWRVEYFGIRDGLVAGVFTPWEESTGHPR